MRNWLTDRVNLATKAYNEWPDSFKEAFRLSTVVDRVPPTLAEGVALLAEIDRLQALCDGYREALEETGKVLKFAATVYEREALAVVEAALQAEKEGK